MAARTRLGVWWRMLRPFTLVASVAPVLGGTALAYAEGGFHTGRFCAFLLAAILIQSATNMFNEYFDYVRGLDTREHVGIAGTIVRDGVSPRLVISLAWAFLGTAVALGLYIAATSSWWVFGVGLLCLGVAFLYSGGPLPLSSTPLGELAAGLFMGPVMIVLIYYTQALRVTATAVWVAVPIGLMIGAILLANNIRDIEADRAGGRHTLPIVLGRTAAVGVLAGAFVLAYGVTLGLVAAGRLSPWALLVLLSLPSAVRPVRLFLREREPARLHPAVKGVAQVLARFGALLVLGLLLSVWV
ncbi:1,4-dihydroxy-2-naphthoate polyprenyltransferase [Symbiobacterium terraclitae]|uniref:1,4-dihydroxy-2-naphthoate polyprenyltransferase n=1 Tax=Symbiobacterium terraclitae TaxID=557451 RepID=UPI0035B542AF